MSGAGYRFGPFRVDLHGRQLLRDDAALTMGSRHFDVLAALVSNAGALISKDALVESGWPDVAVTDNSLEQAISSLRAILGPAPDGESYIRTVPRRGYAFAAVVEPLAASDAALDDVLEPHRAWLEGRTALESLTPEHALIARRAFMRALERAPHEAPLHVGLANAGVWLFEASRADDRPATDLLEEAVGHAREACRLDVGYAEAWATLGFVLHRAGRSADALAATRRAIALEPGSWRHHVRAAFVSWGEERLRAADRAKAVLPGLALAHWLAATVYVARQAIDLAEQELDAGIAVHHAQRESRRFGAVGLHWLRGLVRLSQGDEHGAIAALERELADERAGHLYSRECCANTSYALAAIRLRQGDAHGAADASRAALARVPGHAPAAVVLAAVEGSASVTGDAAAAIAALAAKSATDGALAMAVQASLRGESDTAIRIVHDALVAAPPGNDAWIVPVEPVLGVTREARESWTNVLALLRARAA